ncbi:hypothetical protein AC578_7529, partial [Pseudocercospora eumusae]
MVASCSPHHAHIRETFHNLAVAKILSHRKHKGQGSHDASDNGSDPSYTPAPTTANYRLATYSSRTGLRCFKRSEEGHSDALGLWDSIWFGDDRQSQLSLNGKSWNEVKEDYFERTEGGNACRGVEPHAFDEAPLEWDKYMQCVACEKAGQPCEKLHCELLELTYYDEASYTTLKKNIWSVNCSYEGREVKALLKEMPERERHRLGYERRVWQFWKLNGGYTTDWLLTDVPQNATTPLLQSDVLPESQNNGKRRRRESSEQDDQIQHRTRSLRERMTRSRSSGATLGVSTFSPINGGHTGPSTRYPGQPDSRPNRDRGKSFDSLYDTTPAPQSSTRIAGPGMATQNATQSIRSRNEGEHRSTLPDTQPQTHQTTVVLQERPLAPTPTPATTIDQASESKHQSANEPPSPPPHATNPEDHDIEILETKPPILRSSSSTLRFPIWFKSKVVFVDDSMSVQNVFARLHKNLRRQIEAKKLLAVELRFQQANGETLITVDEDDEDGWEMV